MTKKSATTRINGIILTALLMFSFLSFWVSPIHPVSAAEETNIDSFDVHPANRWVVDDDDADIDSVSISNGKLKVVDAGDGTGDYYQIGRDLRDLNGRVTIRFHVSATGSTPYWRDRLMIEMNDDAVDGNYIVFILKSITSSSCNVELLYSDSGGTESINLAGAEDAAVNEWLLLVMDYSLLKSEFRWRLYYENGSKIFDYDWYDVAAGVPLLFSMNTLRLNLEFQSYTSGSTLTYRVDYIEAGFKEREWESIDTPTDPEWNADNWNFVSMEDNLDDTSTWSLTVPELDSVSGSMVSWMDTYGQLALAEYTQSNLTIYAVDADDGDLHELLEISMVRVDTGVYASAVFIYLDNVEIDTQAIGTTDPRVVFTVALEDNRDVMNVRIRTYIDHQDTSSPQFYDLVGSVKVSDVATDPSNEFVIRFQHDCDFDGDLEYQWLLEDFSLLQRDIFSDIGGFVDDLVGLGQDVVSGGVDLLATLFRWLGDLLGTVFKSVGEILEDAIGLVETAVEDLISYIEDIGSDVIEYLISVASDVVEAIFDALAVLWDSVTAAIFALWDAVNMPDFLAWIDWGLTGLLQAVDGGLQWVQDVTSHFQTLWGYLSLFGLIAIFGLPLIIGGSIGGYLETMFKIMGFDVSFGLFSSILPRIPLIVVWLVVLQVDILDGTALGGFLNW